MRLLTAVMKFDEEESSHIMPPLEVISESSPFCPSTVMVSPENYKVGFEQMNVQICSFIFSQMVSFRI